MTRGDCLDPECLHHSAEEELHSLADELDWTESPGNRILFWVKKS